MRRAWFCGKYGTSVHMHDLAHFCIFCSACGLRKVLCCETVLVASRCESGPRRLLSGLAGVSVRLYLLEGVDSNNQYHSLRPEQRPPCLRESRECDTGWCAAVDCVTLCGDKAGIMRAILTFLTSPPPCSRVRLHLGIVLSRRYRSGSSRHFSSHLAAISTSSNIFSAFSMSSDMFAALSQQVKQGRGASGLGVPNSLVTVPRTLSHVFTNMTIAIRDGFH